MLSKNITICIFAANEEQRINRCIENFSGLFKILVVDNFSTDNTAIVAEAAGARVVQVKNPGFFETPEVMLPVQQACDTDYILIASVSEVVPMALLAKYAEVANSGSHDVVRPYRVSITAGVPIPISGLPNHRSPGEIRFFKKHTVDYSGNIVHERGRVTVPEERVLRLVGNSDLVFYQFRDYDVSHTEKNHRAYNDVLAEQRFKAGEKFSRLRLIVIPIRKFLGAYVRNGSWRFGMLGFIHSFHRWYMEFSIILRIWEWENSFTRNSVVAKNLLFRSRIEAENNNIRSKLTKY